MKNKFFDFSSIVDIFTANRFVIALVWRKHRKEAFFTLLTSLLIAFIPYTQRAIEALLINDITLSVAGGIPNIPIFMFIFLIPGVLVLNAIVTAYFDYYDGKSFRDLRATAEIDLAEKLVALDIAVHEDPKFRDKVQLLEENGSSWVLAHFHTNFLYIFQYVIGFSVALAVMFSVNWKIMAFIIIVSIPRLIVELKFGSKIWDIYQENSESARQSNHIHNQIKDSAGIREMQSYQSSGFFINKIKDILNAFHQRQLLQDKKSLKWQIISQVLSVSSIGFVVWYLLRFVTAGVMQIGTFIFILGTVFAFQSAVVGFFLSISRQYKNVKIMLTYIAIMKQDRHIKNAKSAHYLKLTQSPEIIFENVSFAYPSKPETFVLKDFNLKIAAGEKLAIVGINGAGKSTFIKLLCRFYDPTAGRILVNGIDLREVDLDEWYRTLALLAQDYQTYKFRVKELIHLGRIEKDAAPAAILEAGIQSDADEFIKKWENSYEQQIGVEFTGGIDPSQGQKQKLALARALFRDALVTILDEPTAAVDAKAEKQIFEQLEKNMGSNKTLILISHRFATVRNADKIAVIKGHNVGEYGTHEELLKLGGLYAEMYMAQAEGYKD